MHVSEQECIFDYDVDLNPTTVVQSSNQSYELLIASPKLARLTNLRSGSHVAKLARIPSNEQRVPSFV